MIPELDTDKYRAIQVRLKVISAKMEEAVKDLAEEAQDLEQQKAEMEADVFEKIDLGQSFVFDEFQFFVKEGPRRLSNPAGFHIKWNDFIQNSDGELDDSYKGLITEKISYKGPTLAKIEKLLIKSDFIRKHYEEIKAIFGYKQGNPVEQIKVIE